jgi:hypothetical protein
VRGARELSLEPFPRACRAGEILADIRREVPLLGLTFGSRADYGPWAAALSNLSDEELLGCPPLDASMAAAVRSGLFLRGDRLEASHEISQGIPTPTGSYWHGILHRREPDFDNARYWFRRAGEHPLFSELFEALSGAGSPLPAAAEAAAEMRRRSSWDPFQFIELCEACHRSLRPALRSELECLQELEVLLLLRHSYAAAAGC